MKNTNSTTETVTLTKTLTSDLEIFKAWEKDKDNYIELDKLLRDFLNTYGMDTYLGNLIKGKPRRSVVRNRALFILYLDSTKTQISSIKRLCSHDVHNKYTRAKTIYNTMNKLYPEYKDKIGLLSVMQLARINIMASKYPAKKKDIFETALSIDIKTSSQAHLKAWSNKFLTHILARLDATGSLTAEAICCLEGIKDDLLVYKKGKNLSVTPFFIYEKLYYAFKKYGIKPVLHYMLMWNSKFLHKPLLFTAAISSSPDTEDFTLTYTQYCNKYFDGIKGLFEEKYIIFGQLLSRFHASISDPAIFQKVAFLPIFKQVTLAKIYLACEMSEAQLDTILCQINTGQITIRSDNCNELIRNYRKQYPKRTSDLVCYHDVLELHKKYLNSNARISAAQLQTAVQILVQLQKTTISGSAEFQACQTVIAKLNNLPPEQGWFSKVRNALHL